LVVAYERWKKPCVKKSLYKTKEINTPAKIQKNQAVTWDKKKRSSQDAFQLHPFRLSQGFVGKRTARNPGFLHRQRIWNFLRHLLSRHLPTIGYLQV
jgi:hypothetical protein